MKEISDRSFTILINTQGELITSESFAAKIAELGVAGNSEIVFVAINDK